MFMLSHIEVILYARLCILLCKYGCLFVYVYAYKIYIVKCIYIHLHNMY